jgi:hypothetical protein
MKIYPEYTLGDILLSSPDTWFWCAIGDAKPRLMKQTEIAAIYKQLNEERRSNDDG